MAKNSRTTIFISSTCYDLGQVRENIRDYAKKIGMEVLISESGGFPVDPSVSTLDNCLDSVRSRADIFLLMIGGRYGSITDTGKSITNLEYIEAVSKGIPKYVFIQKNVLALLPVWKSDPAANFSSVVDNPKLFEFISTVRDSGEVWVFPFESSSEIISILSEQISYLFADSLHWRSLIKPYESIVNDLDPITLKAYAEHVSGWEYLCLGSLLKDRVKAHYRKKFDLELGISLGDKIHLNNATDTLSWFSRKLGNASAFVETINPLFKNGIPAAVGAPGEPGDIRRIEHFATKVGEIYLKAIDWSLEFYRLDAPPEFNNAIKMGANLISDMLGQIEEYSFNLYDRIKKALDNHQSGDTLELVLTLTITSPDELIEELRKIQNSKG